jgi:WD40 repeat protein
VLLAGLALLAVLSLAVRAADPPARPEFRLEKTLEGHQGKIWCVGFSPDGKLLATASFDRTIKLWKRQ